MSVEDPKMAHFKHCQEYNQEEMSPNRFNLSLDPTLQIYEDRFEEIYLGNLVYHISSQMNLLIENKTLFPFKGKCTDDDVGVVLC